MEFDGNPGSLRSKIYIPKNLPVGAALVVVLHGCTQNAAGYDYRSGWSRLADEAGFALLYPEQHRSNNPNLCFNWFRPEDIKRGGGEALSIRQLVEAVVVSHKIDRQRIFVTGLSAGGAMACVMLATYPDVFAAGAIIAGLPYGSATTIPQAFDRMRGDGYSALPDLSHLVRTASSHTESWPRVSIWQGDTDRTVDASNAQAIAVQWQGVHQPDTPAMLEQLSPTHRRWTWCNSAGEAVIELNMIELMGHGTPLSADDLGAAGPYMLDVGISSTREIANFWGIADKRKATRMDETRRNDAEVVGLATLSNVNQTQKPFPWKDGGKAPVSPNPEMSGVGKVITDALRAAGLMR